MNLEKWEIKFKEKIQDIATSEDPAHDLLHFDRVVGLAKKICKLEDGKYEIVIPAAWLHDLVIIPKNDTRRTQASKLSAQGAIQFLDSIKYPSKFYDEIFHAIEGHSYSANIELRTIEAKIVQDADRLDGLGAIGIARCFATAGIMRRTFYIKEDPFCLNRLPDDSKATLDHFYTKLFRVAETLKTESGKIEGQKRLLAMKSFLKSFKDDISCENT